MSTLGKIWENRKQILEGVANAAIKDQFVEDVAAYRMEICKKCKFFDGNCVMRGTGPCCGACGCALQFKTRSLSAVCGMTNINKDPLWLPVLSEKQEDELNANKK